MNSDGICTGAIYGVLNSLIGLKTRYPDYQFLMAWDGKSEYRLKLSKDSVEKGIIEDHYKSNRKDIPKPLADFYLIADYLKKGIDTLGIPQIRYENYEADDVLATYAKILGKDNEVILVTSDKDYYQMLSKNVSIYDGMKQQVITEYDFKNMTGLNPIQWVDVGALMGDDGDHIEGVPGWGDKTAIKEVLKYGTVEEIISSYIQSFGHLRDKYPDLDKNNIEDMKKFDELKSAKSEKGISLYNGVRIDMPYSGVLSAYHDGKVKMTKTILMCLLFQDRIRLAYKLKKSIDDIPNLPEICEQEKNMERTMEFLKVYEINSLVNKIMVFFEEANSNTINNLGVDDENFI